LRHSAVRHPTIGRLTEGATRPDGDTGKAPLPALRAVLPPNRKPPSPPSGRYSPQEGEKQNPFHRALRSHMLTACTALGILDSLRDVRECFAMS
jgi:hypothetical protein